MQVQPRSQITTSDLLVCYSPEPFDVLELTSKTKKDLGVPLPAGKKLFLGLGKSGQITRKAAERPAD